MKLSPSCLSSLLWLLLPLSPAVASVCAAEQGGGTSRLVQRFALPPSPIEITQPAKRSRFFDVMARRAGVLGAEGEGFEAWVYPLKLFHDCRISVAIAGTDEVVDLGSRIDAVTARPESVTFTATHSLFTIRQTFFTPLDRSGSIILLDVDSARPLTLTVSLVPDLKPMWPAGLGGQSARWDDERQIFIISESRRKYNALIGCPAGVRGSSTPAHELGRGAVRFDIKIDPQVARQFYYPIVISGGQTGRAEALGTYDALLGSIPQEYEKLIEHYRRIREERLSIETPEPDLNLGLEWAKVAFDKGFVTNPDLGTGLIAGWGTSGESARPGFGWFFGGDTFINEFAISSYGDFETMRQAFKFLQERQRADGKMMHELSQAAAWIKWFEEYPYGYYHGDTTPFYITAFYDYYQQSGDTQFLRESWESLKKAYSYCKSADETADGLMDNTKAGLGASELGSLLEGLQTDVLLGALSPAAWRAMAAMADTVGDDGVRAEAQALFDKAVRSANEQFWNAELGSLVHALTRSGGQNKEFTAWPAVGIMLGIFDEKRADATAEMLGSAALSTDWGARMLSNTSKAYDPSAYNNGGVWPFLTGFVGMAQFERHRSFSGYQAVLANARLIWSGALGYHPELLSGDYYRPLETSVPHQLFSAGGMVTPLVRGLLGLTGDAPRKTLKFIPHMPPGWAKLRINRYRIGNALFNISFERSAGKQRFIIEGSEDGYRLHLAPALGLLPDVRSVTINNRKSPFKLEPSGQDSHCVVSVTLKGRTEIEISYEPGVEIDATIPRPQLGDTSSGLKILSTRAEGNKIVAVVEGRSGHSYQLRLGTPRPILNASGGELRADRKIVDLSFPMKDQTRYIRTEVTATISK